MYTVKNKQTMTQTMDLIHMAGKIAKELNELLSDDRYTCTAPFSGGALEIHSTKGDTINFGYLEKYPHCYDFQMGTYNIFTFSPNRYLMGEQMTMEEEDLPFTVVEADDYDPAKIVKPKYDAEGYRIDRNPYTGETIATTFID